jgi:predicted membrane chloride channel (bestrophin family)
MIQRKTMMMKMICLCMMMAEIMIIMMMMMKNIKKGVETEPFFMFNTEMVFSLVFESNLNYHFFESFK